MMTKNRFFATTALIISGCTSSAPKEIIITAPEVKPIVSERCLVSNPTDIKLARVQVAGKKALQANFTVTTPTPGYQFTLKVNTIKESAPEQVVLDLIVTRPSGIVIQVLSNTKVNTTLSSFPYSKESSVQVNCGGKLFFKADKIY